MSIPVTTLRTAADGGILTGQDGCLVTEDACASCTLNALCVRQPKGFSHLPPDIAAGIAAYDERVADGELVFDDEGFAAATNPGVAAADAMLKNLVASHICD